MAVAGEREQQNMKARAGVDTTELHGLMHAGGSTDYHWINHSGDAGGIEGVKFGW